MESITNVYNKKLPKAESKLDEAIKQAREAEIALQKAVECNDSLQINIAHTNWNFACKQREMALREVEEMKADERASQMVVKAEQEVRQSEIELRDARSDIDKMIAQKKWEMAFEDLENAKRQRNTAFSSPINPLTPVSQDEMRKFLYASPILKNLADHADHRLRNPWRKSPVSLSHRRKKNTRKKCASYYNRYEPKKGLAQCCFTNIWGDSDTVVGAHLLPVGSTPECILESLEMETKLNDYRNVIPMLKTIEAAYDAQRLCIVLDESSEDTPKYHLMILDPTLRGEMMHEDRTFQAQAGEPFELPVGQGGVSPFTRVLSFHAQSSYERAIRKGWIQEEANTHRPIEYGSPLDNDTIVFSLDTPKAVLENSTSDTVVDSISTRCTV